MNKRSATIFLSIFYLTILITGIAFATSDTSSELDELLPSREDIPDQFRNVNYKNEILNENGFLEGRSNSYDRTFDGYVILSLRFKVYKFTNSETATSYFNKKVNEIEQQDNYLEVEIPSTFAFISENGLAETGNSWSVLDNLVFNVEVYNDWDEDTENMLITYTLLELDIIPEFPMWITPSFFIITTFVVVLIKKKLLQNTIVI